MTEPLAADWDRRPEWMRTVRFRLALTYSAILFAVAALVLAVVYVSLRAELADTPLAKSVVVTSAIERSDGTLVQVGEQQRALVGTVEAIVNQKALDTMERYSATALAGLFLISFGIGWWLSGRALRPVERITSTAREITASDLTRRIHATGPDDELRRLADTVDAMLDRLDEAFESQRRLVDDASHELRNPLAIIQTNVDAVLARDDAGPQERAHAVAVVDRATARMSRLVEDLLATSRRAASAFVESDVDLSTVAGEAVDELALLAGQHGVTLRRSLADPVEVIGDRDALRRAVANLVSNAVRFSPEAGDVLVASGRHDGWGYVAVRDEGPGIATEDQGRIFDRFFRAGGHATHDGHAGLGLAIVRQIVESHNGRVAVHSNTGEGSTFVLWLPAEDVDSGTRPGLPPTGDPLARSYPDSKDRAR